MVKGMWNRSPVWRMHHSVVWDVALLFKSGDRCSSLIIFLGLPCEATQGGQEVQPSLSYQHLCLGSFNSEHHEMKVLRTHSHQFGSYGSGVPLSFQPPSKLDLCATHTLSPVDQDRPHEVGEPNCRWLQTESLKVGINWLIGIYVFILCWLFVQNCDKSFIDIISFVPTRVL